MWRNEAIRSESDMLSEMPGDNRTKRRDETAIDDQTEKPRLSARRAEAAANDARVLATARAVLTVAPGTPMAEIAARAGVGVGSLYRRFPSKEALAYRLCLEGMNTIADVARDALVRIDEGDPWEAFVGFVAGAVEAGAGSLRGLAGTFTPDDFLNRVAVDMAGLIAAGARARSGGRGGPRRHHHQRRRAVLRDAASDPRRRCRSQRRPAAALYRDAVAGVPGPRQRRADRPAGVLGRDQRRLEPVGAGGEPPGGILGATPSALAKNATA